MTDVSNPYQSPEARADAVRPILASGGISEKMFQYLRGASPWMRFLGVLGFSGCGIFVALGILMMTLMPGLFMRNSDIFVELATRGIGIMGAAGGLLYISLGVLCFFPCRWVYRAGTKIREYGRTGADADLEEAFRANKAFWKFAGILTVISIAIVPVLTVIGVIGAALM